MLRPLHAQDSSTCAFLPQGVTTTPPAPSTHVPSALSGRGARAPAQRLHPQVLLLPGTDPLRSVLPQPALRSQQAIPHSGRPGLIATRFAPTASAKLCGSQSRARTFWETRAKLFPRIYPAAPRHRGALTCEDITTTAVAGCARSGVARSGIAEAGGDPELAAGADDHQQPAADDGALVLGQRKRGRACRGVDDSSRAAPSGLLPRAGAAAYVLAPARPGRSQWRPGASSPPGGVGRGPARPPSGPQAKKQRWTDRPGR